MNVSRGPKNESYDSAKLSNPAKARALSSSLTTNRDMSSQAEINGLSILISGSEGKGETTGVLVFLRFVGVISSMLKRLASALGGNGATLTQR